MFSSVAKCVATCRCRVSGTENARRGSHDAILMRLMKEFLLNARLVRMIKRQRHSRDRHWDTSLAETEVSRKTATLWPKWTWLMGMPKTLIASSKTAPTRPEMQIKPKFRGDDGVVRFVDPREMFSWLAVCNHKVLYVNESRPERRFHVAFFFARNSFTTDAWINDPKLGSTHNVLNSSARLN